MSDSLAGRVAMVTGGSSGIGRAVCLELARRGATLAVVGRNEERTKQVVSELEGINGISHFGAAADVRCPSQLEEIVDRAFSHFGRLDALVASAGIAAASDRSLPYRVSEMPAAAWDEVVRTNLTGAYLTMRAVLPRMMERRRGDIIVISSARAGRFGAPYAAAYCASKFGLNALSACAAAEMEPHGIRIQILYPDLVQTPMLVAGSGQRIAGHAIPPQRIAVLVAKMLETSPDVVHRGMVVGGVDNQTQLGTRWGSRLTTAML